MNPLGGVRGWVRGVWVRGMWGFGGCFGGLGEGVGRGFGGVGFVPRLCVGRALEVVGEVDAEEAAERAEGSAEGFEGGGRGGGEEGLGSGVVEEELQLGGVSGGVIAELGHDPGALMGGVDGLPMFESLAAA